MSGIAEDAALKPADLGESLDVVLDLKALVHRLADDLTELSQVGDGGMDCSHQQVPLAGGQQLVGAVQAGTEQMKQQVLKARK